VERVLRIAAAQAHPIWGDADATTEKVVGLIREAASEGVGVLAFPETFLPGYPFWALLGGVGRLGDPRDAEAYGAYLEAAVAVDGPHVQRVADAAHEAGVFVYLGLAERVGCSVYATLAAISPDDGVVGAHRKLMPTHGERTVWALGDGHGLRVHDAGGVRVGGLNCWENWMPLARYALYAGGEELHVGAFPGSALPMNADLARLVALEGRLWVLIAAGLLSATDVPARHPYHQLMVDKPAGFLNGGSCIVAPDGTWRVAPVVDDERLVIAEIEQSAVARSRQSFDPAGHSSRADVFDLQVDRRRLNRCSG
jgi:nitrilase